MNSQNLGLQESSVLLKCQFVWNRLNLLDSDAVGLEWGS